MAVHASVLPERYGAPHLIARGGMADVYVAEDRELGRSVAIKVPHDGQQADARFGARFKREALTAAQLGSHPHIAVVHDVGEWNGRPYIVMEAHERGSIASLLREQRIGLAQAMRWLAQAAEALDFAHERGVVHRDVKPANLLIDDRGELQVTDFGIAHVADDSAQLTADGAVLGTLGYLAPEQLRGEPASPASDLYALAIVAHELLFGERPARGLDGSAAHRKHALPRRVGAVLDRALSDYPHERHPNARAFVDDLRAGVRSPLPQEGPATAPEPVRDDIEPVAVPAAPRGPAPADSDGGPPRWISRSLLVAVIVTATLVGGAVGFVEALALLATGLLVGGLGRLLTPGHMPIGMSATALLGAMATLLVGVALRGTADTVTTFVVAVAAAALLIAAWRRFWRIRRQRHEAAWQTARLSR